jgi:hypothetical protein
MSLEKKDPVLINRKYCIPYLFNLDITLITNLQNFCFLLL